MSTVSMFRAELASQTTPVKRIKIAVRRIVLTIKASNRRADVLLTLIKIFLTPPRRIRSKYLTRPRYSEEVLIFGIKTRSSYGRQ
jgi:hypothetical protein